MDLKEVIEVITEHVKEAHNAFHAGHPDFSRVRIEDVKIAVEDYFRANPKPESDVTESATTEKPDEKLQEKPAEVPGSPAQPAAVDPAAAALGVGVVQPFEKPTQ